MRLELDLQLTGKGWNCNALNLFALINALACNHSLSNANIQVLAKHFLYFYHKRLKRGRVLRNQCSAYVYKIACYGPLYNSFVAVEEHYNIKLSHFFK